MIHIICTGQTLRATSDEQLVAGTQGRYEYELTCDDAWDGLVKRVVFEGSCVTKEKLYQGTDLVPWEVLEESGELNISVVGYSDDEKYPTRLDPGTATLRVYKHGALNGDEPSPPPTPSPGEQALAYVKAAVPEQGEAGNVLTKQEDGSNAWMPGGGGGGGTSDHRQLNHRDADNSHPMSAITDLLMTFSQFAELIASKQDKTDEELETSATTVVGAINELRSLLEQEGQTRSATDETIMQDLDTKVDKVAAQSGSPFVYGRMSIEDGGAEGKFTMASAVVSGAVVKRAGNQIKGAAPISNDDVANKLYVDSGDATAKQYVKQDSTTLNYEAPILLKANDTTATATGQVYFATAPRLNPATGAIKATSFIENGTPLANKYLTLDTLPRYNGEVT